MVRPPAPSLPKSHAMLFALIATDKPDHLETRLAARPAHMDFLNGLQAAGSLVLAGPFLDAEGSPRGSLVVVKSETLGAAKAMLAEDPYQAADLFASVDISAWNWTFNKPEGL